MKTLILTVAMAATVSAGSQAFAATMNPTNAASQGQTAIGSEAETGQQAEAAPRGGEAVKSEGTAERATTQSQQPSNMEQWTGSPDPQRAKEGEVRTWQDFKRMHERAFVEQPEGQQQ